MKQREDALQHIEATLDFDQETLKHVRTLWDEAGEAGLASVELPESEAPALAEEAEMSASATGLQSCYVYDNYVAQANNTCGQAVIGSYVDHFGLNPFGLQRSSNGWDGKQHFDNREFIGKIFQQFGPDWPWPNGVTVRETILKACQHYGLKTHEWYPGAYSDGSDAKKQLTDWISKYRLPVTVLLDTTKPVLGNGQPFTLHWCMVYAYDHGGVYIATWARKEYVDWNTFMKSWHCDWLPYPNNFYQLRAWKA